MSDGNDYGEWGRIDVLEHKITLGEQGRDQPEQTNFTLSLGDECYTASPYDMKNQGTNRRAVASQSPPHSVIGKIDDNHHCHHR